MNLVMAALSNPHNSRSFLIVGVLSFGLILLPWYFLRNIGRAPAPSPEALTPAAPQAEAAVGEGEALPEGWERRTGVIQALGPSLQMEGTHQLVSSEGDLIIILESSDEKLRMAEGLEAEVQGPVRLTVEGDQQVLRAERIIFR